MREFVFVHFMMTDADCRDGSGGACNGGWHGPGRRETCPEAPVSLESRLQPVPSRAPDRLKAGLQLLRYRDARLLGPCRQVGQRTLMGHVVIKSSEPP